MSKDPGCYSINDWQLYLVVPVPFEYRIYHLYLVIRGIPTLETKLSEQGSEDPLSGQRAVRNTRRGSHRVGQDPGELEKHLNSEGNSHPKRTWQDQGQTKRRHGQREREGLKKGRRNTATKSGGNGRLLSLSNSRLEDKASAPGIRDPSHNTLALVLLILQLQLANHKHTVEICLAESKSKHNNRRDTGVAIRLPLAL